MPEVVYDGDEPERDVVLPEGRVVRVKKGEKVDVSADAAKSLLESAIWRKPGAKKKEEK